MVAGVTHKNATDSDLIELASSVFFGNQGVDDTAHPSEVPDVWNVRFVPKSSSETRREAFLSYNVNGEDVGDVVGNAVGDDVGDVVGDFVVAIPITYVPKKLLSLYFS